MTAPLLQVKEARVHFPIRKGLMNRVTGHVKAVDGISFTLGQGETLSVVGESGSGKSTLGYAVMGMEALTAGQILHNGVDQATMTREQRLALRRDVQIIFQDPISGLNPRMTVRDAILEPLNIHGIGTKAEREARLNEVLDIVSLPRSAADRLPRAFSGGQRQRLVIARALALRPKLIVCDEPVSALDVSIQSQVLNLLLELQKELGLSYLFISHDMSVVHHISDRVLVMRHGKEEEQGEVEQVFQTPRSPYTQELLAAVPRH